jgi:hypothetical protein
MVSKCANPGCFATFRYLHEGKLFVVGEHPTGGVRTFPAARHGVRCFWLCSQCSRTLAVIYDTHDGMRLIPVPAQARPRTSCEVFLRAPKGIRRPEVSSQSAPITEILRSRITALR